MTKHFRRELVGVVALTVLGLSTSVLLLYSLTRPAGPRVTLEAFTLSLQAKLHAMQQIHSAADVIVYRDVSGRLMVSGRAVAQRVEISSIAELRSFLTTLPRRGIGLVTGAYQPEKNGVQGLWQTLPADVLAAQHEIRAALDEAGFIEPRNNVKSLFPSASPR
jgi:hypothetical protein